DGRARATETDAFQVAIQAWRRSAAGHQRGNQQRQHHGAGGKHVHGVPLWRERGAIVACAHWPADAVVMAFLRAVDSGFMLATIHSPRGIRMKTALLVSAAGLALLAFSPDSAAAEYKCGCEANAKDKVQGMKDPKLSCSETYKGFNSSVSVQEKHL